MFSFSLTKFTVLLALASAVLVAMAIPARLALSGPSATPTGTPTPMPSPTFTVTAAVTSAPGPTSTASAMPTPTAAPTATATAIPTKTKTQSASGYWHTSGNRIVDSAGHTVRIAAVNWFGMENVFYVPAGLDRQPLDAIVARVRQLGFNAIRLPFSNQVVERNPIVVGHLEANPDLQGLHALDLLDRIVAAAQRHGLRIILDDGRSNAGTQPQENGLWYTRDYPESAWIHDWITLVQRYAGNPTVVGVDLRNEPHTGPPGPWSLKAYLHQGSTWGPYGGVDNKASDWRLAAERGGNAVLAVNSHLLIFVEGLQLYPDPARPNGVDTYWWGGVLQAAGTYPVQLAVPNQMVYSPHEYGPTKVPMYFFGRNMSYASLSAVWDKHWGYLTQGSKFPPVPIFIGEFGTCGLPRCVQDATPGSTGLWFTFWMRYLKEHPHIGWAFWALNGTNQRGVDCPSYILRGDWQSVRLPPLLTKLRDVGLGPNNVAH